MGPDDGEFEDQFVEAVTRLERIVETASKTEPDIAEDARKALDAAQPILADLQDVLADVDEAAGGDD